MFPPDGNEQPTGEGSSETPTPTTPTTPATGTTKPPEGTPATTPTTPSAQAGEAQTAAELAAAKAELEKVQAKYERLQADLNKYRTRADERDNAKQEAERAQQTATELEQRIKKLEEDRDQLTQEARTSQHRMSLYKPLDGDEVRIKAALNLAQADGDLIDGEAIKVDELLERYPFLQPQAGTTEPTTVPGARSQTPTPLSGEAISGMGVEQFSARKAEIFQAAKEGRIKR